MGRSKRWTFWNTSTGALESFRGIQTKIQQKWAGLQPEGQRNQKLGLLLSSLWCFIFGPDVYVVSLQTSCSFICCVSQMSIILHRAICPGVKTSNISTIDSAFILFIYFFCKTHLFKAFSPLNHLFVSLFSISCLSLGWQSPWATVGALISNPKVLGMMCHIGCVSTPVTFTALIIYMIYLTAPAKGRWITINGLTVRKLFIYYKVFTCIFPCRSIIKTLLIHIWPLHWSSPLCKDLLLDTIYNMCNISVLTDKQIFFDVISQRLFLNWDML